MMTPQFLKILPITLGFEGGFSDRPSDPGGATMLGVTRTTLSRYLMRAASLDELKALTATTVQPIYFSDFWLPSHAGDCPPGVDLMVFDAAVNSGPIRSLRWLQQALGVTVDEVYGELTRQAAKAAKPATLITQMAALRSTFLHAQSDAADNPGWFTRVSQVAGTAQAMATAAATAPAS